MSAPSVGKRRMNTDIMKLIESKHEVTVLELNQINVKFFGPPGTPYEGGVWKVRVYLPENYPFRSPIIRFINKIFHPNIEEASGRVCINVIMHAWTPLYDLLNIFESFLPQLLTYPNAGMPMNPTAGALYLRKPTEYKKKVAAYIKRYATAAAWQAKQTDDSSDSESSMSDLSEDEVTPMEM